MKTTKINSKLVLTVNNIETERKQSNLNQYTFV